MIVFAMGASSSIFKQPEVAVTVTVVLLTTLITPLIMPGAFAIKAPQDDEDEDGGSGTPQLSSAAEFSVQT